MIDIEPVPPPAADSTVKLPSLETSDQDYVESILNPQIETDNAGYKRVIYHKNGLSFTFKGREEIPQYPAAQKSQVTVLGERPNWIDDTEFDKYTSGINKDKPADFPVHYLANKTLTGVLNLALKLDPHSEIVRNLLDKVEKGQYDQDVLNLIDTLISVNYVDEKTNTFQRSYKHSEALVVLSLTGDKEAKVIVDRKIQAFKVLLEAQETEKRLLMEQDHDQRNSDEIYEESEIACVHATNFLPEIREDGTVTMKTLFDSTGGKGLRSTLHFYLNDIVQPNVLVSWDDAPILIVAPYTGIRKINGLPEVLHFDDTWWIRNPKEPLILPSPTVLTPGGKDLDTLFEKSGYFRRYKSEGLTAADIGETVNLLRELGEYSLTVVKDHIDLLIPAILQEPYVYDKSYLDLIKKDKIPEFATLHQEAADILRLQGQGGLLDRLQNYDPNQSLRIAVGAEVQNLIDQHHLLDDVMALSDNPELLKEKLIDLLVGHVEKKMVAVIKRLAVKSVLKEKGYYTGQFGMHALSSEKVYRTARKHGIYSGRHADTPQDNITDMEMNCIRKASTDHRKEFDFDISIDWTRYQPNYDEIVVDQNPDVKTLRMLYDSGLLVARV